MVIISIPWAVSEFATSMLLDSCGDIGVTQLDVVLGDTNKSELSDSDFK